MTDFFIYLQQVQKQLHSINKIHKFDIVYVIYLKNMHCLLPVSIVSFLDTNNNAGLPLQRITDHKVSGDVTQ